MLQLDLGQIERLNGGKHCGLSGAGAGTNNQAPKPLGIYRKERNRQLRPLPKGHINRLKFLRRSAPPDCLSQTRPKDRGAIYGAGPAQRSCGYAHL